MHRADLASQAESTARDDGLALRGAWVAAAVRCAPPDNAPSPAERDACRPFLAGELAILGGVRVVVCLGSFAYAAACRELSVRPRPKFAHGAAASGRLAIDGADREIAVLCSYHPSQQNTFTGRLTEEMLDGVFAEAVRRAR
jgi:uracil-DNA glycosylase family 4